MMLVAATFAFYRGWTIHVGRYSVLAYILGVIAFGLAVWHLTRRPDRKRVKTGPSPGSAP
jgi:hypothetical protein